MIFILVNQPIITMGEVVVNYTPNKIKKALRIKLAGPFFIYCTTIWKSILFILLKNRKNVCLNLKK